MAKRCQRRASKRRCARCSRRSPTRPPKRASRGRPFEVLDVLVEEVPEANVEEALCEVPEALFVLLFGEQGAGLPNMLARFHAHRRLLCPFALVSDPWAVILVHL